MWIALMCASFLAMPLTVAIGRRVEASRQRAVRLDRMLHRIDYIAALTAQADMWDSDTLAD